MEQAKKLSVIPFIIIGLLAGICLAYFKLYAIHHMLPYLWVGLFIPMFLFAYPVSRSLIQLTLCSAVLSLIASIPFVWQNTPDSSIGFWLATTNAYAILAFHISFEEYQFKFPYESLFFAVWDNFVKILIAAFFIVLCGIMLGLWGELFKLIEISFFSKLFRKAWFIVGSIPFLFSIGIFVSSYNKKITENLRQALLTICHFLLPVLAIISILFIFSWIIVTLFLETSLAFDSNIFLSFSILSVIFTNGVYQTDTLKIKYGQSFLWLSNFFLIIAPVFSLLVVYSLFFSTSSSFTPLTQTQITPFINITDNGLNAYNFNLMITAIIMLSYNIAYALIASKKRTIWLKPLRKANIFLAILFILVILATNNPWFKKAKFNPGNTRPHTAPSPKPKQVDLAQQIRNAGYFWAKTTEGKLPPKAIILGYNTAPIYVCRFQQNGTIYGGIVLRKQCHAVVHDTVVKKTRYSVFSGQPKQVLVWRAWPNLPSLYHQHIPIIINPKQKQPTYICRTIYKNHLYVGIYHNETCFLSINDKAVKIKEFLQYLHIKNPQ